MPSIRKTKGNMKPKKSNKSRVESFEEDFDNEDTDCKGDDIDDSFLPPRSSSREEDASLVLSSSKKRSADEDYETGGNFSHEMQRMLEGFGADISKTLGQKKKRVEQFTQNSLKNTTKKVEEIWNTQYQARSKLQEEFGKQANAVYQQWEADIEKAKEQEEKLNALFKQQQKLVQQARIVQSQRLKTIRELSDQFMRGIAELDQNRQKHQSSLQSDLKKEMSMLQKKILMDTQQQEMANVRKSLHSMLRTTSFP